jgi:hypothetical protein
MAYGQTPDSNPVRFFTLRSDVRVDVCQATMGQDPQSWHKWYKVFIPGASETPESPLSLLLVSKLNLFLPVGLLKLLSTPIRLSKRYNGA